MEIEWSNGVVEVIKIVLGCFFAMRLLSKQIKSVRTIGKFGKFLLWTIVYGIILFFAKRLFYDPVKQLLFVTVTCELVLFIANCGCCDCYYIYCYTRTKDGRYTSGIF